MEDSELAPIVLFVYNRPRHTAKTLLYLSRNDLVDKSNLFIFADGPRVDADKAERAKIKETRDVCRSFKSAALVKIVESETNQGLAASITRGVGEIINRYGKIIVLEDDLELSPQFLNYMNKALNMYAENSKVFHISGYWYPEQINTKILEQSFFYRATSCWGWGTWKDRWRKLETDPKFLMQRVRRKIFGRYRFNIQGGYDFFGHLEKNAEGTMNTWAIKWYASVFINNGLCLHPKHSYVNNFGHDGSGTNCKLDFKYRWEKLNESPSLQKVPVIEERLALKVVQSFFAKKRRRKLRRKVRELTPIFLKRIKRKIKR